MVELPSQIPVKPPEIKRLTNPREKSMAGVNLILPLQIVVSQLNTLMAEGMAISRVRSTNTDPRKGFKPVTNMWWAHTRKARIVMANSDPTIAIYPKIGFLEFTLITSDTIPMAGRMMMYT